jgi:hypothetical protein
MEPGRLCPQNSSRPPASVTTNALTVFARALPETNRRRPARPAAGAAHPDLGGIQQADLPAGAQVGHHIGQGA